MIPNVIRSHPLRPHAATPSCEHALCLLQNIHDCLKPGGFFFGFVPDSATIWSRTQGSDRDERQGELYNLQCTPNPKGEHKSNGWQFGTMDFRLQVKGEAAAMEGCLIHLSTFQKMAEEAGFKV